MSNLPITSLQKQKVYVSSTFKDLEEYRRMVINEFEGPFSREFELSQIMERMYDTGRNIPFVETCRQEVLDSDVYLLILGNRIGSYPPGSAKTYTEHEYDTALESGKLIFRFVNKNFNAAECDDEQRFRQFRERMNGLPVHEFTDQSSFENKLLRCLGYLAELSISNQRRFYITLAVLVGLIGVAAALAAPYLLSGFSLVFISGFVLLTLLIFSCIALFALKYIIFPSTLSTLKNNSHG